MHIHVVQYSHTELQHLSLMSACCVCVCLCVCVSGCWQICVNSMAMSRDRAVYLRGELIDLWDTNVEHMEEALNAWESIKNCGWRANQTIKHRLSRPDGERVQIEDVEDCSIAQACKALGVSEEAKLILRAVIAQTDGGCWDDFGLADFCEDWPYGEINSRYGDVCMHSDSDSICGVVRCTKWYCRAASTAKGRLS